MTGSTLVSRLNPPSAMYFKVEVWSYLGKTLRYGSVAEVTGKIDHFGGSGISNVFVLTKCQTIRAMTPHKYRICCTECKCPSSMSLKWDRSLSVNHWNCAFGLFLFGFLGECFYVFFVFLLVVCFGRWFFGGCGWIGGSNKMVNANIAINKNVLSVLNF